jgi:hypothetical protein
VYHHHLTYCRFSASQLDLNPKLRFSPFSPCSAFSDDSRSQASVMQCIPPQALWDIRVKGECWVDNKLLHIVVSALNLITDAIILFLPVVPVTKLRMNMKKKSEL